MISVAMAAFVKLECCATDSKSFDVMWFPFDACVQPEGLDAEADAEADRIIAEITGEALSSAGAAPATAVPGKQHAAPAAAVEEEPAVRAALLSSYRVTSMSPDYCALSCCVDSRRRRARRARRI
jgi:hypothetical protein